MFASDDHRSYNRHGETFDVGETFAGIPFEVGLAAVRELRTLLDPGVSLSQFRAALGGERHVCSRRAHVRSGSWEGDHPRAAGRGPLYGGGGPLPRYCHRDPEFKLLMVIRRPRTKRRKRRFAARDIGSGSADVTGSIQAA